MAGLPTVNNDTFEQDVLKADLPVLVDFSAEWCGPCKSLAPKLEELSREYDGRVRFFNLDVDQARDTAMQFGVMSVPTLIVFKNGEIVAQKLGNQPREQLVSLLDSALGG